MTNKEKIFTTSKINSTLIYDKYENSCKLTEKENPIKHRNPLKKTVTRISSYRSIGTNGHPSNTNEPPPPPRQQRSEVETWKLSVLGCFRYMIHGYSRTDNEQPGAQGYEGGRQRRGGRCGGGVKDGEPRTQPWRARLRLRGAPRFPRSSAAGCDPRHR